MSIKPEDLVLNLEPYKSFLLELADLSGALIKPYFFNPELAVESKKDQSPVTEADRAAERLLRERIMKKFPGHGIIGEEYGQQNSHAEFVWVLDPIDGTLAFTHGVPLFGTLVGLLYQGKPLLGMINQPISQLCCLGDGRETTLNGRVVHVRTGRPLDQATLLATDLANVEHYQNIDAFTRLMKKTKLFRTWADCYGYLLVAAGMADIMLDPVMNPWDLLPLIPIIEGAGGIITDWQGKPAGTGKSSIAANARLHRQVLEILKVV